MKKLIILVVMLIAAGSGYYFWSRASAKEAEAAKAKEQFAVAQVKRGDLSVTVSATGRVVPEREVEIKCKASGEVKEVLVDISDPVKHGDLLFKLDPVNEQRNVNRLKATLSISTAKVEQVRLGIKAAEAKLEADRLRTDADLKSAEAEKLEFETKLRRAKDLYTKNVISREEMDVATTKAVQTESTLANAKVKLEDLKVQAVELEQKRQDLEIAKSQLENDRIALDDAEQRLKETEVYSPITGVVSARTVQEGFIVSSGISNVGGGTTTMKVVDLSHIYAVAAVDEADIRGVKSGITAVITADAFPGVEFSGKVVQVATSGVMESNVVTFNVKVEVEGRGKELLKPEMTTNVRLLIDERKNTLLVPAEAVVRKAVDPEARAAASSEAGGRKPTDSAAKPGSSPEAAGNGPRENRRYFVTVRSPDGTEQEKMVRVGLSDTRNTEITQGVAEGDTVVYRKGGGNSRWAGMAPAMGPMGPVRPAGGRR